MKKEIKDFRCPHCGGFLKVHNKIILLFENKTQGEGPKANLVLLDPTPGEYIVIFHCETVPNKGDNLELFCPMCYDPLNSNEKAGLSEIDVVAEDGLTGKLFFAPNMGDHATFVVWQNGNVYYFGKDVNEYSSLFTGFGLHEGNSVDAETARLQGCKTCNDL